jgi:hypothetical protein
MDPISSLTLFGLLPSMLGLSLGYAWLAIDILVSIALFYASLLILASYIHFLRKELMLQPRSG